MNELTDKEKELLAMIEAAEEEELKKPASERPAPMSPGKTEYPIGIALDASEKPEKF